MRRPRRLTTIATAACLALTAVGCSGEPGPKPTSFASDSGASESAKPGSSTAHSLKTTAGSAAPPAAVDVKKPSRSVYTHVAENTELGAAEAVEYFVETYLFGLQTGDSSFFDQTYASVCTTCIKMKRRIEDPAQRLSDIEWETDDVRVGTVSTTRIQASIHVTADAILVRSGHRGSNSLYVSAMMEWRDGKWVAIDAAVEVDE